MGLGSGIRKKPIPDPGSRDQKGTGSRIRNTAYRNGFFRRCKSFGRVTKTVFRIGSVSFLPFRIRKSQVRIRILILNLLSSNNMSQIGKTASKDYYCINLQKPLENSSFCLERWLSHSS